METKDILQFIMIGAVIMGMGLDKVFKWMKPNGVKNGNSKHGERITVCETEIKTLKKDQREARKENREEHKQMFDKLEDIRVAVAKGN